MAKKEELTEINAPMAYVTAVELLQVARKLALERKDIASLIDVANSWIEVGHQLLEAQLELQNSDEDDAGHGMIGFGESFSIGFTGGSVGGEEEAQPSPGPTEGGNKPGF